MNPGAIICQLPTWDYAMAGYVISSLPEEIRNALTRTEMLVVQMLFYLMGIQARRSGRQAPYAVPGQCFLGTSANRSDRTVRRALSTLVNLGLIGRQRRRPIHGLPQTNIYRLGSQLLALLHNIKWPKSAMKSHKDKNVLQRPKERSRHRARSSSGVIEEWRDSHKPADLASLPVPGEARRLSKEEAKHGFEQIKAKIREKTGRR